MVDTIFQEYDKCFSEGNFKEVDANLRTILVKGLSVDLMIAHLSASFVAKEKFPYYGSFKNKVKRELFARLKNSNKVQVLLQGL